MKLLVIYLYFAEPKGSGPATMRILSYIDFHNQLYEFKSRFFFENFYGQKRLTRMIPMPIDFKIHFLWLTNLFMISYRFLHIHISIKVYLYGNMTSFLSWILPMLYWFYVQDRYLSCPKIILGSSFHIGRL